MRDGEVSRAYREDVARRQAIESAGGEIEPAAEEIDGGLAVGCGRIEYVPVVVDFEKGGK